MTTPQRSYNMSRIKGKDTKPEMIVRKYLWAHGFRYRLNHRRLPGKPDIVLRKYRTCVFVNGCFWHGHKASLPAHPQPTPASWPFPRRESAANAGIDYDSIQSSECCKIPHTNREFWVKKIMRNKERDIEVQHQLADMGWHCITVWECQLSTKTITKTKTEAGASKATTVRQQTLESIAYTLNKIYLQDHAIRHKTMTYCINENDNQNDNDKWGMAAEDLHFKNKE